MPPPKSPTNSLRGIQGSTMASNIRGTTTHFLKRSFSTPSVGGVAPSFLESQSLAPPMGEKKRNKLGYHRTSIACGHCRRRKIRCIISTEDQNRCVNCIRLKKDCSFHPVDQQQPYDQKQQPPQTPGGSSSVTASSSPVISRGSSVDQGSHRHHYPSMPVVPVPGMGTPTIQTPQSEFFPSDIEASSNTMPSGPSYAIGDSSSTGWMTADTDEPREPNPIWRPSFPVNIGGQLSPYADPSNPSAAWSSSSFASANDLGWSSSMPPPPRSMSFSGEMLGSQHPPQYYPVPQQNQIYRRPSQHFTHMYTGVPVRGTDESIEQAIDPAIMGSTAVQSTTPITWQQQQTQQQQLIPERQQHQLPDAQGGAYRTWGAYGEVDRSQRM